MINVLERVSLSLKYVKQNIKYTLIPYKVLTMPMFHYNDTTSLHFSTLPNLFSCSDVLFRDIVDAYAPRNYCVKLN